MKEIATTLTARIASDEMESGEHLRQDPSSVSRRRPNYGLAKGNRNYSVEEIARLLSVHKNTVREWIRSGLATIDRKRPTLVLGRELAAFLKARRDKRKKPCRQGEMYCFRCRVPKFPAGGMADYSRLNEKAGNLTAICPECGCMMHRCVSNANLGQVCAKLDIRFPVALQHLEEIVQPTLNRDLS